MVHGMVILSEKVANAESNICYLICLRHLIRSKTVTDRIFSPRKKPNFLHACATYSKLPSNMSTMVHGNNLRVVRGNQSINQLVMPRGATA